ncbi:MAG: hypothetical protein JO170_27570 [Verrucomicrobia bacterium]|nr:hypothetical protein [Verrucomicrobiota bacterium]
MLFRKILTHKPFRVLLNDLEKAIRQNHLKTTRRDNSLFVRSGQFVTRIDVVPPANKERGDASIEAVVQIKTEVPREFADDDLLSLLTKWINAKATLGALIVEKDHYCIGSRLTIYDQDSAWNLHFGLLLFTILGTGQSFMRSTLAIIDSLQGCRTVLDNEEPSAWTTKDLSLVEILSLQNLRLHKQRSSAYI